MEAPRATIDDEFSYTRLDVNGHAVQSDIHHHFFLFFCLFFTIYSQDVALHPKSAVDWLNVATRLTTKTIRSRQLSRRRRFWPKKDTWWESRAISTCRVCPIAIQRRRTIKTLTSGRQPPDLWLMLLALCSPWLTLHARFSLWRTLHDQFSRDPFSRSHDHNNPTNLSRPTTDPSFSTIPRRSSFQLDAQLRWIAQTFSTAQLLASSRRHLWVLTRNKKCSAFHWPTVVSRQPKRLESAVVTQTTLIPGQSAAPGNTLPKSWTRFTRAELTSPSRAVQSRFASSPTVTFFRNHQTPNSACTCHRTPTEFKFMCNWMPSFHHFIPQLHNEIIRDNKPAEKYDIKKSSHHNYTTHWIVSCDISDHWKCEFSFSLSPFLWKMTSAFFRHESRHDFHWTHLFPLPLLATDNPPVIRKAFYHLSLKLFPKHVLLTFLALMKFCFCWNKIKIKISIVFK